MSKKKTDDPTFEMLAFFVESLADLLDEIALDKEEKVEKGVVEGLLASISFDATMIMLVHSGKFERAEALCKAHPDVGTIRVENLGKPKAADQEPLAAHQEPLAAYQVPGDDPNADPDDPASWN